MIKKKDCLTFILDEKWKARDEINKKYTKEINAKKESLLEENGYLKDIKLMQHGINKVNELFETFILKIDKDDKLRYRGGYSNSFDSNLKNLKEDGTKNKIIFSIDFEKTEVTQLIDKRTAESKKISDEYDKVYNYCKSLTKSKDIITYLQSLGFDTSSIPDEEAKALVCKVDTNILFSYKNIK